MKSKLIRPLLITAAVLAVFVGGYFLLDKLGPAPEASPTGTPAIYVIKKDAEVERVRVKPADSATYEVTVTKEDDKTTYNVIPAREGFEYNSYSLSGLTDSFTALTAMGVAKEAPTEAELSSFGFDKPLCTITASYKDGSSVELIVGGRTVTKDGYYAKSSESGTVYTISDSAGETFLKPETALRKLTIFPAGDDQDDPTKNVRELVFTRPDGSYISLRRRTDDEIQKGGIGASIFEMSLPQTYNTNDSKLSEKFIQPIQSVAMAGVAEDDPSDLSKYGLDKPYKVELTDTDGKTYGLLIGNYNGSGSRYLMKTGVNSVLLSDSDFSFLKETKMDLISSSVWIYNIDEVLRADFDLDGEKHVLTIDSDSTNKKFTASLDGGEITETNARHLYMRTISFSVAGEVPQGAAYGDPQYAITLTFRDGSSRTLKLCPLNDRQFAVVFDGKAEFYINVKDIEYLTDGFKINARGEEIPSM